ncbi:hypothetical protein OJAV_G00104370 [Oryzias javanicus]|uniref:Uncharacterized protein n=1 Tax=Oryzias javanicus TaxID=123683 RepID=A0A437CYA3_ORYJA|nr:hypothetical protein OJAV_G00104370 [Oryzias javanicus]
MVLHNRSAVVEGFYRPLPPTTFVKKDGGNFTYQERVCLLPVALPRCDCSTGHTEVSAGKQVILIGMNGRYNLSLPTPSPSTAIQPSTTPAISQPTQCSHGGEDNFYPVKKVLKKKKQKGKLMEYVEWEPCSMCGKTWSPQWVEKKHTKQ